MGLEILRIFLTKDLHFVHLQNLYIKFAILASEFQLFSNKFVKTLPKDYFPNSL